MRPQSNGNIERYHRTLASMLTMYCESDQKNWDHYLQQVMMAYRSSIHASTGHTPNKMTLGRETTLPIQVVFGKPDDAKERGVEDYLKALEENLKRAHEIARKSMKTKSMLQKKHYDLRARRQIFNVGDPVWIYDPQRKIGVCSKLTSPWKGPAVVVKVIDDVHYKVKRSKLKPATVYHSDRLAQYRRRNLPTWVGQQKALLAAGCEDG